MLLAIKHSMQAFFDSSVVKWCSLLVTELIIIFLGVYMAEVFLDRREARERGDQLVLIVEALGHDISPFLSQGDRLIGGIRSGHDGWRQSVASAEMPKPFFVPATGSLARPHGALWDAMLDAGALDLLPIELAADIAEFYVRTDRMFERYSRLDEFAQAQILPNLDREASFFYDPDSAGLRPMYRNYMDEAEAVLLYSEETLELGRGIQTGLEPYSR